MTISDFSTISPELREQVLKLYQDSFPAHERRSNTTQQLAFSDKASRNMVVTDEDGRLQAIVFYWTYGNVVYVEFLAVNPEMRGRSIGSAVMKQLMSLYPDKLTVLEIEPPEDEMTIRRLHFYERLGFVLNPQPYVHPSYCTGEAAHSHRLSIMSHGRLLDDSEFDTFTAFVRNTILKYID